jgi:hydroxymethylglutaryl-CoA lyase
MIPQMVDTTNDVLAQLDLSQTKSKLLAIIANTEVLSWFEHKEIQYLGFPISENFQMRNTHKTIAESLLTLTEILRRRSH